MSLQYLRHVIKLAQEHENANPLLLKQLEQRLVHLHSSLSLQDPNLSREQQLYDFVLAYVQQVPYLLETADKMLNGSPIGERLLLALNAAENFFLEFNAAGRAPNLLELLDKAYLAHRLIEEMNDLYIKHMGLPLIPVNTTLANVIVHYLIGEQKANQFELRVMACMKDFMHSPAFAQLSILVEQQRQQPSKVRHAWLSWPCLSAQLGVQLAYEKKPQNHPLALLQ